MYINEFVAGVLSTIGLEAIALIAWAIWYARKHTK